MPVRGAVSVPWHIIEGHNGQAVTNHGQSLERLRQRGGLDAVEAYLILNGLPLRDHKKHDVAECKRWLNQLVQDDKLAEARKQLVQQDELVAKLQQRLDATVERSCEASDLVDAFQTASGLWDDGGDPSSVTPADVQQHIFDLNTERDTARGHRDAAADILQTLLQEPLGSDKARKALDMAGAWLVAIAKEGA